MRELEAPPRYSVSVWDRQFSTLIVRRSGDDVEAVKSDALSAAMSLAFVSMRGGVLLVRDGHALGIGQTTIYDITSTGTLIKRPEWSPLVLTLPPTRCAERHPKIGLQCALDQGHGDVHRADVYEARSVTF